MLISGDLKWKYRWEGEAGEAGETINMWTGCGVIKLSGQKDEKAQHSTCGRFNRLIPAALSFHHSHQIHCCLANGPQHCIFAALTYPCIA